MTGHDQDVFTQDAPRVFTVSPGQPFLENLANAVRRTVAAHDSLELADALIYLPTRRAVRGLAEAFLATSPQSAASLLPRMRALGDIDEDEIALFEGEAEDEIDLPPAISSLERRLTLAQMVAARDRAFDGQENWAGAIAAADELGKLLDSFYTEEISPDALTSIVPETLAEHWRDSLKFLSIIIDAWPAYLQERGLMDPAARRVKLIDLQTERWRASPPQTPVIVAGTTGSAPAVARMMKFVASLPMGCAVLPGLDMDSPPDFWDQTDETHPQQGLHRLLKALDIKRAQVKPLPTPDAPPPTQRDDILSVALRPADASDSWRDWAVEIKKNPEALQAQLAGLELTEASDEEHEATAIALKIREALENPAAKVMLVTPDRDLARRVSVKMRRWDVMVDDSAGVPFPNSPCGTFLRLVAIWLAEPTDAVALMAVVRHPLFGGELDDRARRKSVDALDLSLRGLKPGGGEKGLREKVAASEKHRESARPVLDTLCTTLETWPDQGGFEERLAAHLRIAEALAATDEDPGDARLWRGEDGEAGAAALADIQSATGGVLHDAAADYPAIFRQLIAGVTVRRHAPAHPRIAILGPLEARLQHADVVILGGLNEGVWPRDAAIDPFLSRPMRREIGLPSPEQRIGLAAHDFAQLAAAPSVMLTRATRAAGKPTKPSRWIVRLKNILKGAEALEQIERTHNYETLATILDRPEQRVHITAPQPRPPVDERPTDFFVTRIEKLLRDPYAIYARTILRLEKLDSHNEPLDARHIGNLFHRILQEFAEAPPPADHNQRVALLHTLFNTHAPSFGISGEHLPFWRRRAAAAFEWLAQWEADRRTEGKPAILEDKGVWPFKVDGRDYTLGARVDRIDLLNNGSAFIIDYKTGTPPPTKRQAKKFSPQLSLTGLIVANGGFEKLGAVSVDGFEYVRVISRTGKKEDDAGAIGEEARKLIAEAETGLYELMRHFSDSSTAYLSQPRPQYMDDFGDYDHLARRRERNAQGGDE